KRSLREAKPDLLNKFVNDNKKTRFDFVREETPDKLMIEIESVKVEKAPEGVVEVYLNLGPNETPDPKSKSYVGLLDLFSITHANAHKEMRMMASETKIELNASRTARALNLSIEDLKS